MIYPKRVVRKAASGVDMSTVEQVNAVQDQKVQDQYKTRDSVQGIAKNIPVWGAVAGATTKVSDSVRGTDNNIYKGALAGVIDPFSGGANSMDSGASSEDSAHAFLDPIGGGIRAAQNRQRQARRLDAKLQQAKAIDMQNASNVAYGQLTYKNGGELEDNKPDSAPVQDLAVVLGGDHHKDGGNSVLDYDSGEKVAETEREELLVTKKQTDEIEKHIMLYDQTKDQSCLLKLGEYVKNIIDNEMIDHSGKYTK